MKIILIPGWNESAEDMRVFVEGRNGFGGLAGSGFDCTIYSEGSGSLTDRIGQFGEFLARLKAERPEVFPVGTFGYSADGVIARGFLRAFPERADEIAATFQVGAPNAGVVTDDLAVVLGWLHISPEVIEDLDIESPFMTWLNGTPGHWETDEGGVKRWKLDRTPWVAPAGARILNALGRMPRYDNRSDGIVLSESGTLDGHLPHHHIDGKQSNHLNLPGVWNFLTLVFRGWRANDLCWPAVIEEATLFFTPSAQKTG